MGLRGPIADGDIELRTEAIPAPPAPETLHPVLQLQWEEYWASDVAKAADTVDLNMLTRLFLYRDELYRKQVVWALMSEDDRYVEAGRNRNTIVEHPMVRRMEKLEDMILRLEDKLGLSPLSRARLGIELGQAQLTWKQLEEAARGDLGAIADAGARVIE